jgi:hypothetical protein
MQNLRVFNEGELLGMLEFIVNRRFYDVLLISDNSGMTTKGISMDRFYQPRDASQQQQS